MEEDTKKVRGNPVLPDPPVPSQVMAGNLPPPPPRIPKEGSTVKDVGEDKGVVEEEKVSITVDDKPKGTIIIKVFENSPYEVEFEGMITGSEVDIAWKAMMKAYRVWKHNLSKEKENGGV